VAFRKGQNAMYFYKNPYRPCIYFIPDDAPKEWTDDLENAEFNLEENWILSHTIADYIQRFRKKENPDDYRSATTNLDQDIESEVYIEDETPSLHPVILPSQILNNPRSDSLNHDITEEQADNINIKEDCTTQTILTFKSSKPNTLITQQLDVQHLERRLKAHEIDDKCNFCLELLGYSDLVMHGTTYMAKHDYICKSAKIAFNLVESKPTMDLPFTTLNGCFKGVSFNSDHSRRSLNEPGTKIKLRHYFSDDFITVTFGISY
jgi:hypothetical protein